MGGPQHGSTFRLDRKNWPNWKRSEVDPVCAQLDRGGPAQQRRGGTAPARPTLQQMEGTMGRAAVTDTRSGPEPEPPPGTRPLPPASPSPGHMMRWGGEGNASRDGGRAEPQSAEDQTERWTTPELSSIGMATASTSGQSSFGLGRKKKNPGLLDQIGQFFGGDKKKRSKGSFRGHLASSPQQSSSRRRRTNENALLHFFRSLVSSPPRPKSRVSSPRSDSTRSPVRKRRDQSTLSRLFNLGESKSRPPPKRWSTIF